MNGIQVTWIVVVSVIIHQSLLVVAFGRGASPNACDSMKPGHGGATEQTSTVPYELAPDNQILDSGECQQFHCQTKSLFRLYTTLICE